VFETEISPLDQSNRTLEDVLNWVPCEGNEKEKYLSCCPHPESIAEEDLICKGCLVENLHGSTR